MEGVIEIEVDDEKQVISPVLVEMERGMGIYVALG